ncbi:serine hydrolase domain-containing protein [Maricaulis sp.]|uniref:serine hydrolase domain-containing protein n=1 Tax=Maricaulis sp. TaxID=1486257 RepID=UPI00261D7272|nr:serine hydrolase domain-containing protein [Maricaulis sp.]
MSGLMRSWGKITAALAALLLLAAIWALAPVYGFFAHRGEAPLGPFGWTQLPDGPGPVTQDLLDPAYAGAAEEAARRLEAWRARIGAPALSAAVAVEGEIVWRGAAGWSDLARATPATPDTIFRIGSTSKAVTATALARQVQRGELDLDAPLATYFADLPNPAWTGITARQLASHMAGVPHYGGNSDTAGLIATMTMRRHYPTVQAALDVFDGSALGFEPGTDFNYSSLGTVLLGAAMSEAGGLSYRDLIAREVIEPAGAQSTLVAPRSHSGELANFYLRRDQRYRVWRPVDLSHRLPGGGWASTPSDLVRIGSLWLDEDFISPETREAFWTPQSLANGETNEQDYALGWRWREFEIEGVGIARNANHGGVSRGSQSWLLVFPDYEMSIAFNTNMNTEEFAEFGMFYQDLVEVFAPVAGQE